MNSLFNTTKPTLLKWLCQKPEFMENTLSNTTKPTLLDSLSQYHVSLEVENEILSNTTKFTLLDSLRQDSDLSIKAYSLLQEVCINCFKSKYMLAFKH